MKHEDIKLINEDEKYIGKEVTVCGWIKTIRKSKNVCFVELNDGTSLKNLQLVINNYNDKIFNLCNVLTVGSSISATGTVVKSINANQNIEMNINNMQLIGKCPNDYPIQKKRQNMEFLREIPHLRTRTNTFNAVFRVRSILAKAFHDYFQKNNFTYVNTPIITGSDCEGAGEMFRVTTLDLNDVPKTEEGKVDYSKDFFGKETNLTVSGQLNGEAYALAFRNIYTFGPTFRAENSNTARHAAEFWMVEPEISFADLEDNMKLAEEMLTYVIKYVMNECPEEIEFFNKFIDKGLIERLNHVANSDFARVSYTDAVEILKNCGKEFEYPVEWGIDLQTEHERYLTEEHFKRPLFVTDYPKDIKAFYMRMNDDNKTVAAMDLLVPGIGEIIGGSQREERLDVLKARMAELNLNEEDYWWYLELRKYGGTKHSGYGLGFERLIMYITGMSNIRDVIPFPRTTGQSDF